MGNRNRYRWIAALTAALVSTAAAPGLADEPEVIDAPAAETIEPQPVRYWVGLLCQPPAAALAAQLGLPEGVGLVVERVVPDGPAAQAGIEAHDVLIKAGDADLTSIDDLSAAVQEHGARNESLKIQIVRAGQPMSLEMTPVVREAINRPDVPAGETTFDVWKWLDRTLPGVVPEGPRPPLNLRLFRPGQALRLELPADVRITVDREGDEPAKVTVKKGEQTWEVTEETLNELPPELRVYAEAIVNGIPASVNLGLERARQIAEGTRQRIDERTRERVEESTEEVDEAVQRGLEWLERQRPALDRIQQQLDELQKKVEAIEKRLDEPDDRV